MIQSLLTMKAVVFETCISISSESSAFAFLFAKVPDFALFRKMLCYVCLLENTRTIVGIPGNGDFRCFSEVL